MIRCTFENGGEASLRHVTVHAIAEHEGAILLVKRSADILEGVKRSLPSGFLDRNEKSGEGALRELFEETGWEGKIITPFLIKTDPDRPHEDRQNIAMHFLVNPVSRSGTADSESTAVVWVPVADLPDLTSMAFDHGEAIGHYLRYREHPFALPIFI